MGCYLYLPLDIIIWSLVPHIVVVCPCLIVLHIAELPQHRTLANLVSRGQLDNSSHH